VATELHRAGPVAASTSAPLPVWKAYLQLLRPKGFVAASLFVVTGYALSPAARIGEPGRIVLDLAWLFVGYVVLVSGGSLWLNSACDRDTGPVSFLARPPPPPRALFAAGLVAKSLGVIVFAIRGLAPGLLAGAMLLLSVAYSHGLGSGRRLKSAPPWDAIVNGVGYGALSVLLGASIGSVDELAIGSELAWAALAFSLTIIGSMPASQIYQLDEAGWQARSDFASWLGRTPGLRIGALCFALGCGCALVAQLVGGPRPMIAQLSFAVFLGCFVAAAALLVRWSTRPAREDANHAQRRYLQIVALALLARVAWIANAWLASA
jgi:hypothetical protein